MKHYQAIANFLVAMANCRKSGNSEWLDRHAQRLELILAYAPSGSGFDNGTRLDIDASNDERLIFLTSFHHMNDGGYYDGWTEHKITVKPNLLHGFTLTISGRDRNQIKDYIGEVFHAYLGEEERVHPAENIGSC